MSRIVIVDDEEFILKGLKKLIQRAGSQYRIIGEFTDSEEALKFLNSHQADVLISDIRMPQMDGIELIEKARAKNKRLHCIVLSGYNDFSYAKSAIRAGVVDYLLKPVDDKELKNTLLKIIEHDTEKTEEKEYFIKSGFSRDVAFIKHQIESDYVGFDTDKISLELGKSKEYLSKLYKKETGNSIKDYLKEIRILRAKELLESAEAYKIYEVSELVGFPDTVYFSKQFKSSTGMTPKEYQDHFFPRRCSEIY